MKSAAIGVAPAQQQLALLHELLTQALLKLDRVSGDGEVRLQRKKEVRRGPDLGAALNPLYPALISYREVSEYVPAWTLPLLDATCPLHSSLDTGPFQVVVQCERLFKLSQCVLFHQQFSRTLHNGVIICSCFQIQRVNGLSSQLDKAEQGAAPGDIPAAAVLAAATIVADVSQEEQLSQAVPQAATPSQEPVGEQDGKPCGKRRTHETLRLCVKWRVCSRHSIISTIISRN